MKRIISLIITLLTLCTATLFAQVPEKFSYQSVIRNANNALVVNAPVGIRVSILQDGVNGSTIYMETHTTVTNANGLITLQVGNGNVQQGTFTNINWANGLFFLKIEVDPNGGIDYSITSTQQLLSVPYALYSKEAGNGFSGDYNDLINLPQIPQIPTEVSAFTNDAGYLSDYTETDPQFNAWDKDYNDLINKPELFSGDYNDLTNQPSIPTVNDATLTIQQNGMNVGTFTANQDANQTVNITTLTAAEVQALINSSLGAMQQQIDSLQGMVDALAGYGFMCGFSKVKDVDGNEYNTVQIGGQCWIQENLRTTHFADGTAISIGTTASETTPYYYDYSSYDIPLETRGYLYNWTAAMNGAASNNVNPSGVQGICPNGWHLPSDAEWTQLTNYVGSRSEYTCGSISDNIAKALSSTEGWRGSSNTCAIGNNPNTNNASGFKAIPAGYCYGTSYSGASDSTYFWSSTEIGNYSVYTRTLRYDDATMAQSNYNRANGLSVRCLRNGGGNTSTLLPTITTGEISDITDNTASCGGEVTADGGAMVTERGVCWGTSATPTISDNHTSDGTGIGTFTSNITGLTAGTTYYVRAYATNSLGTAYGEAVSFITNSSTSPIVDEKSCPGTPTVTDIDGNTYGTVKIGEQCWMRENLRTTKFADGLDIPIYENVTSPYSIYYSVNPNLDTTMYGYYYNWYAAMYNSSSSNYNPSRVQGVCPNGWHLPSRAEWEQLRNYLINHSEYNCGNITSNVAKALASTEGWNDYSNYNNSECYPGNQSVTSNNASGFSAIPAGYYGNNSYSSNPFSFFAVNIAANFWSSTSYDSYTSAYIGSLNGHSPDFGTNSDRDMKYGLSVRCLHDGDGTSSLLPTVTTGAVSNISDTTAACGGEVTSDGGSVVTARGICWGSSPNPAITGAHTSDGTGIGSFTSTITDLIPGSIYYVRAFATNSMGTAYGETVTLTTTGSHLVMDEKSCPEAPSVTDIDGNTYNTVKIGEQCWMRENLRTSKYPDGAAISPGTGYRMNPNVDVMVYGYYYKWYAAMHDECTTEYNPIGVQGVCPDGWHLPSNAEWMQLINYVKSQSNYVCGENTNNISKALASTKGWQDCNSNYNNNCECSPGDQSVTLNNATGFSIVPAGYYDPYDSESSTCEWTGYYSYFVSSTQTHSYYEYHEDEYVEHEYFTRASRISNNEPSIGLVYDYEDYLSNRLISVRCLKDIDFGSASSWDAPPCPGTPTVTDADCNVYNTVQIGDQCWMKENLRTRRYSDNTQIFGGGYYSYYTSSTDPYYYDYSDHNLPLEKRGLLYNWPAAMHGAVSSNANPSGVQGICPTGWHLPSDTEWTQLINYVSSISNYQCGSDNVNIAKALASTEGWNTSTSSCAVGNNQSSNNATGFSAFPAGYFSNDSFDNDGTRTYFWSSTQKNNYSAYYYLLNYYRAYMDKGSNNKSDGRSVRCLRN